MSVDATVVVAADQFELGEVLDADRDVRIDLAQFVPIGETFAPYFWVESDGVETFESTIREDPRIADLTALNAVEGDTLYRIEWKRGIEGLFASVADHDVIVKRGVGVDGTWTFRLRAADRETLSAFHHDCIEKGISIELRRVVDEPGRSVTNRFELTDKQYEAVALALEAGYFDVPRGTSLTDLAERVGISRQAYSRRLQRGLRNVLEAVLPVDGDIRDPA